MSPTQRDRHEFEALVVARAFTGITPEEVGALPRELVAEVFRAIGTDAALEGFEALHARTAVRTRASSAEVDRAVVACQAANAASLATRGSPIAGAELRARGEFHCALERVEKAYRAHNKALSQERRARSRAALVRSAVDAARGPRGTVPAMHAQEGRS